eukprot:1233874-Prorocentrum_lima.AAC.1
MRDRLAVSTRPVRRMISLPPRQCLCSLRYLRRLRLSVTPEEGIKHSWMRARRTPRQPRQPR